MEIGVVRLLCSSVILEDERSLIKRKNKEYFLEEIKQMHVVVREVLEEDIRFITDNEDCNIVAFKDVAESTIE